MTALKGPIPSRILVVGDEGQLVKDLQRTLIELNDPNIDPGLATGKYTPKTAAAVKQLQIERNLKDKDGKAGTDVWKALGGDRFERKDPVPAWVPAAEPGKAYGGDFSTYQNDKQFADAIANMSWVSLKATEGQTLVDHTFAKRWKVLGDKIGDGTKTMKLRVAYLFLHAGEPGDGAKQAKFFLETVGIKEGKLPPGTRLAIDWEGDAVLGAKGLNTLIETVNTVQKGCGGIWPMVYAVPFDAGVAQKHIPQVTIWQAKWGGALPGATNSPFVQNANGPNYDHDLFQGNDLQLRAFAGWL